MELAREENDHRRVFFDILRHVVEQVTCIFTMSRIDPNWPIFSGEILSEYNKLRPIRNWAVHGRDGFIMQEMDRRDGGYAACLDWCMNQMENFQSVFTRWIEETVSVSDIVDTPPKIQPTPED